MFCHEATHFFDKRQLHVQQRQCPHEILTPMPLTVKDIWKNIDQSQFQQRLPGWIWLSWGFVSQITLQRSCWAWLKKLLQLTVGICSWADLCCVHIDRWTTSRIVLGTAIINIDCQYMRSTGPQSWNEPEHYKTNKMICVPSEYSDQPGHLPSLISLRYALKG